jgi:hypothetical protein
LQTRLFEDSLISFETPAADSAQLAAAIIKFQKKKGLAADGRAGEATVRMMNINDREKFIRIAISLDKYKMLPEKIKDLLTGSTMKKINPDHSLVRYLSVVAEPGTGEQAIA